MIKYCVLATGKVTQKEIPDKNKRRYKITCVDLTISVRQ